MTGPLLTTKDVRKLLKCSQGTVYNLIRSGKLPHLKVGALYRFTHEQIQEYLDSCHSAGPPPTRDPEPPQLLDV